MKRRLGLSAMTVSGTRRWRSELVSQISKPVKQHGGSNGDGVSAAVVGDDFGGGSCDGVIPLVRSVAFNSFVLNLAI